MWLLFHRNAGTKHVAGGRAFVEHCPTCERATRFREVEIGESYGVWFVDVVSDAERAFRCDACGDVFDLREQPAEPTAAQRKQAELDRAVQLAAEHRRRDAEAAARAVRIEDELAELKKRMGR